MTDLTGKNIVVTGAGGGIGLAAVAAALEAGANVVATDVIESGVQAAADLDDRVVSIVADVTSPADWEATKVLALDTFGAVHGLVNNAGTEGTITSMLDHSDDMFDRVIDINLKGVFRGMRTFAPLIEAAGGGSIVNVSSVAGLSGALNLAVYAASKHAVIGLTKSGALEFAQMGVRCNAVCPSLIETRMMRPLEVSMQHGEMTIEEVQSSIAKRIPMGRYGEPSEVAAMITFLLSDDSSFVSGAAIPIDGGLTAR